MTAQKPLPPLEIADALEKTLESALTHPYGLYQLRVAIHDLFGGTVASSVELANLVLPRAPGTLCQETAAQIRQMIAMLRIANRQVDDCSDLSVWLKVEASNS